MQDNNTEEDVYLKNYIILLDRVLQMAGCV